MSDAAVRYDPEFKKVLWPPWIHSPRMFTLSCPIRVDGQVCEAGTRVNIQSPNLIACDEAEMLTRYEVQPSLVKVGEGGNLEVQVQAEQSYLIKTEREVPAKLGLMLVGWGGNNGSTLTASLLANRLGMSWETRRGRQQANFYGSLLMASSVPLGTSDLGNEVYVKMHDIVPFCNPDNLVLGGWDISSMSLGDSLLRSRVLEPDLIRQVKPLMDQMKPLPSVYSPSFIASNQSDRADNVIGGSRSEQLERIRKDIRDFKVINRLDKVIVMWTANTERYTSLADGIHDSWENFKVAIEADHAEISPSSLFAAASLLEGCPFINGSPQNTFIPAIIDLAGKVAVPIAGDDFKSGQTKMKSVLVDFLIGSGIKPLSIVSYNHLGNNDGKNLAEAAQFSSKERSKRGVVEDMVQSNPVLYPVGGKTSGPDHTVVIEYVPTVGDTKKALDEYESEIFMGGRNTIVMHNTCEDSLLAAPLMLDLVLLMEFLTRVSVGREATGLDGEDSDFHPLHPIMSLLAFFLKAPLFPSGVPVTNALMKQRRAIEAMLKACVGLPPTDDLCIYHRLRH